MREFSIANFSDKIQECLKIKRVYNKGKKFKENDRVLVQLKEGK